jgi:Ni,Fe-hydrogenase III large subunit
MNAHRIDWRRFEGSPTLWTARVAATEWIEVAAAFRTEGARLQAMWASGSRYAHAAFLDRNGLHVVDLEIDERGVPSLAQLFPSATRMERAAVDLTGIDVRTHDPRPWLRRSGWPADYHPLADAADEAARFPAQADDYPFVRVEGDGVHEIPVGPVHAGIIEPGHFRFSVVGEKVLRLEARLGYVHKGIEQRFTRLGLLEAHRLAARVSGDSAVAFSLAYCRALESMPPTSLPARSIVLRAVALELERLANHLGDLGALGNDAGFGVGLAQFSRLKEELLRIQERALGARYLMDYVIPGGVARDLPDGARQDLRSCLARIQGELRALRAIYNDHPGLHDRFSGAGAVSPDLAARLGLTGLAGRASGQAFDLRCDHPGPPYDATPIRMAGDERGDVLARVTVRFDEAVESIAACIAWLDALPVGGLTVAVGFPEEGTRGYGLVEGWRGPVFVALEAGPGGSIRRCHVHDPSWHNWPVLEHAIIGNIVPDFPLINKSFNLSYSGVDL